ncbi:MAG: NAD(P)-dependent oxidoreductase [bacterium]
MRTLLLTGATGFVGRNVLVKEAAKGTCILAPVRDVARLHAQLASEGISSANVVPLATEPSTWGKIQPTHALLSAGVLFARTRQEYQLVNVDWTLEVLKALPSSCRTVILSSQAAGGPTPAGCQARNEDHPDLPITHYGKSKLELETRVLRSSAKQHVTILRPPMILGARDNAILPLFKMASGLVRPKPGLRTKTYSFIDVEDLMQAVEAAWTCSERGPFYIASKRTVTDVELIQIAARIVGIRGFTVPTPQILIQCLSFWVDAIPHLRNSAPSLTRDRARDIWVNQWVVDSSRFREQTNWQPACTVEQALQRAYEFYIRTGLLKVKRTGLP